MKMLYLDINKKIKVMNKIKELQDKFKWLSKRTNSQLKEEAVKEALLQMRKTPMTFIPDEVTFSKEEVLQLMYEAFKAGYKKYEVVEAGLEGLETEIECNWIFEKYKIIIPQQEPKRDYSKIKEGLKTSIEGKAHFVRHFKNGGTIEDFKPLEPKEETLEEVANKILSKEGVKLHPSGLETYLKGNVINAMVEMSKWQGERMYEIMDAYADDVMGGCTLRAKDWFEQFLKIKTR